MFDDLKRQYIETLKLPAANSSKLFVLYQQ